ncbi:MAG: hypothetical protein OXC58_00130 [Acidimicrobiaceae bacterium]|nr:hypothetical protein [Acidimicrobiaceae bacterium]
MTMRASRSAEGSISGDRLRHCGRRRPLRRKRMRHSESRGSASLELVILVPALTALVLFVMWAAEGGRASLIADLAAEEAATAAAAACELDDPECLDSVAGEVLASRPGLAELCANGPEPSSLVETNTDDGFAVRAGDAVSVGVLCRSEGSVAPVRGFTPAVNFYGQATHVVAGPERNVTLDAPQAVIEGDEIEFTIQVTPPPTTSLTLNLSLTQEGGFVVEKDDTTKVVNDLGSIVKDLPICTIEAALADGTANSDSETGTPDSGTEIPVDEGENSIGGTDPASCSGGDSVITWKNPSVIKNSNADDSWQVKFSLNTQGDDVVEPDGEVTATVTVPDGSDYEAGRQATAKVTIISDDVPAVTIKAGSDVTEGDTPAEAVFTLEVPAGQTPVTDTPIKIMVSESHNQLAAGDTGEKTVMLKAGQNKATHRITIPNDNDVELISTVTVTIQPDDGCSVSTSTTDPPDCPPPSTLTCPPDSTSGPRCRYDVATPSEASLTVKDDDVPGVTIKAGSDVTEGDTPAEAVFTLEVPAGQTPVTDTPIKIMVSESHNQLAAGDTGEKTVTLKAGELEATHTITIPNDNKVEGRSEVTVTIIDGTDDYEIGNPKEASLTVEDDDVPTVTLKAGSDFVTEGKDAEFTITADDAPLNDITVNLSVEETRSMLEAGATGAGKTVTLSAGDTEATYPIPTDDDDVVEKPSEVTVTIQRGEGYNVGAPGKASLTVENNDVPTVTIEAGSDSDVAEGEDAVFTITADQEPLEPITVHLSVEETKSMLQAGATGAKTVMLTASKTTTTHLIQTDDDEVVENSSKVTVTVTPDEKYNPADTPSDSLWISDNDSPAVSVSAGPEITEGEDAVFTVRAHQAPLELLLVRVDIKEASSDFVSYAHGGIRIVEIAAGEKTGELKVPTIDDDVVEGSGEITATAVDILGDDPEYTVVEPTTASIIVNDNEPVVTITAPADPIIEGGKAPVFTLHADPAPKSAVTVPVTVTQDGDFLAPSAIRTYHVTINPKSKTNTLIAGSASGALHLPRTVDDDVTEDAGTVTASIAGQSSTSYTVGEPDTATVAVADNDMTVEVTAVKPEVDEGEPAVFTVEASAAPTEALTVNVDISQAGDFVDRRQTGARKVTIAAGSTTSPEIRVPTNGNNLDQDDGEVTATVTTGTDYTPGTDSSASVIIKDDDSVLRGLAKRRNTFIRCLLNRDSGNRITYLGNRISESSSQEFCTYPMGYFREDLDVMIYFGDPNSAIVHNRLDENYLQKGIPLATPAASCAEPGADVIIARDTIPPTVFGDAPAGTGDALIAPGAIHTVYSTADSDIHIDFKIRVCDDNESEGPEVFALVVDWRAASEPGKRRTDIEVLTIIRSD